MSFKIQYMSYDKEPLFEGEGVIVSELDKPRSLDEFNVNVIDLSSEHIWTCSDYDITEPECIDEFDALKTMINHTSSANILIVLPQNCNFSFDLTQNRNGEEYYEEVTDIKRLLGNYFENWINRISIFPIGMLIYENTTTKINNKVYPAAFHFNSDYILDSSKVLTSSVGSNKNTSLMYGDIYYSTLKISNYDELITLLSNINLIQLQEKVPEWIVEKEMFNDRYQKQIIYDNKELIRLAEEKIALAQNELNKNNWYKSILYTNGNELISVVFEILEKILVYDLSEFNDEKREDFLITTTDVTFIGEIKGVTSNIKNENISQLDVHYQGYIDKLESEGKSENVKALLIMDHQRTHKLDERQPVHINQINLANRNGSLIIETYTLLKLFEDFLSGKITKDEIVELFTKNVGLLKYCN